MATSTDQVASLGIPEVFFTTDLPALVNGHLRGHSTNFVATGKVGSNTLYGLVHVDQFFVGQEVSSPWLPSGTTVTGVPVTLVGDSVGDRGRCIVLSNPISSSQVSSLYFGDQSTLDTTNHYLSTFSRGPLPTLSALDTTYPVGFLKPGTTFSLSASSQSLANHTLSLTASSDTNANIVSNSSTGTGTRSAALSFAPSTPGWSTGAVVTVVARAEKAPTSNVFEFRVNEISRSYLVDGSEPTVTEDFPFTLAGGIRYTQNSNLTYYVEDLNSGLDPSTISVSLYQPMTTGDPIMGYNYRVVPLSYHEFGAIKRAAIEFKFEFAQITMSRNFYNFSFEVTIACSDNAGNATSFLSSGSYGIPGGNHRIYMFNDLNFDAVPLEGSEFTRVTLRHDVYHADSSDFKGMTGLALVNVTQYESGTVVASDNMRNDFHFNTGPNQVDFYMGEVQSYEDADRIGALDEPTAINTNKTHQAFNGYLGAHKMRTAILNKFYGAEGMLRFIFTVRTNIYNSNAGYEYYDATNYCHAYRTRSAPLETKALLVGATGVGRSIYPNVVPSVTGLKATLFLNSPLMQHGRDPLMVLNEPLSGYDTLYRPYQNYGVSSFVAKISLNGSTLTLQTGQSLPSDFVVGSRLLHYGSSFSLDPDTTITSIVTGTPTTLTLSPAAIGVSSTTTYDPVYNETFLYSQSLVSKLTKSDGTEVDTGATTLDPLNPTTTPRSFTTLCYPNLATYLLGSMPSLPGTETTLGLSVNSRVFVQGAAAGFEVEEVSATNRGQEARVYVSTPTTNGVKIELTNYGASGEAATISSEVVTVSSDTASSTRTVYQSPTGLWAVKIAFYSAAPNPLDLSENLVGVVYDVDGSNSVLPSDLIRTTTTAGFSQMGSLPLYVRSSILTTYSNYIVTTRGQDLIQRSFTKDSTILANKVSSVTWPTSISCLGSSMSVEFGGTTPFVYVRDSACQDQESAYRPVGSPTTSGVAFSIPTSAYKLPEYDGYEVSVWHSRTFSGSIASGSNTATGTSEDLEVGDLVLLPQVPLGTVVVSTLGTFATLSNAATLSYDPTTSSSTFNVSSCSLYANRYFVKCTSSNVRLHMEVQHSALPSPSRVVAFVTGGFLLDQPATQTLTATLTFLANQVLTIKKSSVHYNPVSSIPSAWDEDVDAYAPPVLAFSTELPNIKGCRMANGTTYNGSYYFKAYATQGSYFLDAISTTDLFDVGDTLTQMSGAGIWTGGSTGATIVGVSTGVLQLDKPATLPGGVGTTVLLRLNRTNPVVPDLDFSYNVGFLKPSSTLTLGATTRGKQPIMSLVTKATLGDKSIYATSPTTTSSSLSAPLANSLSLSPVDFGFGATTLHGQTITVTSTAVQNSKFDFGYLSTTISRDYLIDNNAPVILDAPSTANQYASLLFLYQDADSGIDMSSVSVVLNRSWVGNASPVPGVGNFYEFLGKPATAIDYVLRPLEFNDNGTVKTLSIEISVESMVVTFDTVNSQTWTWRVWPTILVSDNAGNTNTAIDKYYNSSTDYATPYQSFTWENSTCTPRVSLRMNPFGQNSFISDVRLCIQHTTANSLSSATANLVCEDAQGTTDYTSNVTPGSTFVFDTENDTLTAQAGTLAVVRHVLDVLTYPSPFRTSSKVNTFPGQTAVVNLTQGSNIIGVVSGTISVGDTLVSTYLPTGTTVTSTVLLIAGLSASATATASNVSVTVIPSGSFVYFGKVVRVRLDTSWNTANGAESGSALSYVYVGSSTDALAPTMCLVNRCRGYQDRRPMFHGTSPTTSGLACWVFCNLPLYGAASGDFQYQQVSTHVSGTTSVVSQQQQANVVAQQPNAAFFYLPENTNTGQIFVSALLLSSLPTRFQNNGGVITAFIPSLTQVAVNLVGRNQLLYASTPITSTSPARLLSNGLWALLVSSGSTTLTDWESGPLLSTTTGTQIGYTPLYTSASLTSPTIKTRGASLSTTTLTSTTAVSPPAFSGPGKIVATILTYKPFFGSLAYTVSGAYLDASLSSRFLVYGNGTNATFASKDSSLAFATDTTLSSGLGFGTYVSLHLDVAMVGSDSSFDVFRRLEGEWVRTKTQAFASLRGVAVHSYLAAIGASSVSWYTNSDGTTYGSSLTFVASVTLSTPVSVATHGAYIAVGLDTTTHAGSVSVWKDSTSNMVSLTAFDSYVGDRFGAKVALDTTTLVVSAPYRVSGAKLGAVYVYTTTIGSNDWSLLQQLTCEDDQDFLYGGFGTSVALQDDVLLVGCPSTIVGGVAVGRVYLYFRRDSSFELVGVLDSGLLVPSEWGVGLSIAGTKVLVRSASSLKVYPIVLMPRTSLPMVGFSKPLVSAYTDPAYTNLSFYLSSLEINTPFDFSFPSGGLYNSLQFVKAFASSGSATTSDLFYSYTQDTMTQRSQASFGDSGSTCVTVSLNGGTLLGFNTSPTLVVNLSDANSLDLSTPFVLSLDDGTSRTQIALPPSSISSGTLSFPTSGLSGYYTASLDHKDFFGNILHEAPETTILVDNAGPVVNLEAMDSTTVTLLISDRYGVQYDSLDTTKNFRATFVSLDVLGATSTQVQASSFEEVLSDGLRTLVYRVVYTVSILTTTFNVIDLKAVDYACNQANDLMGVRNLTLTTNGYGKFVKPDLCMVERSPLGTIALTANFADPDGRLITAVNNAAYDISLVSISSITVDVSASGVFTVPASTLPAVSMKITGSLGTYTVSSTQTTANPAISTFTVSEIWSHGDQTGATFKLLASTGARAIAGNPTESALTIVYSGLVATPETYFASFTGLVDNLGTTLEACPMSLQVVEFSQPTMALVGSDVTCSSTFQIRFTDNVGFPTTSTFQVTLSYSNGFVDFIETITPSIVANAIGNSVLATYTISSSFLPSTGSSRAYTITTTTTDLVGGDVYTGPSTFLVADVAIDGTFTVTNGLMPGVGTLIWGYINASFQTYVVASQTGSNFTVAAYSGGVQSNVIFNFYMSRSLTLTYDNSRPTATIVSALVEAGTSIDILFEDNALLPLSLATGPLWSTYALLVSSTITPFQFYLPHSSVLDMVGSDPMVTSLKLRYTLPTLLYGAFSLSVPGLVDAACNEVLDPSLGIISVNPRVPQVVLRPLLLTGSGAPLACPVVKLVNGSAIVKVRTVISG